MKQVIVFGKPGAELRLQVWCAGARVGFSDRDRLEISATVQREHAQRQLLADAGRELTAFAELLGQLGMAGGRAQLVAGDRLDERVRAVRNLAELCQASEPSTREPMVPRIEDLPRPGYGVVGSAGGSYREALEIGGGLEPTGPSLMGERLAQREAETGRRSMTVGESIQRSTLASGLRSIHGLPPAMSEDVVLWLYGGESPGLAKLRAWATGLSNLGKVYSQAEESAAVDDVNPAVARELLRRYGWTLDAEGVYQPPAHAEAV